MEKMTRSVLETRARQGLDLTRAELGGLDLEGADLHGARLERADLRGTKLAGANLSGADLSGAFMREAYLEGANLSDAKLAAADLDGANLRGADLRRADLTRTNLEGADLQRADLTGARLIYAQLDSANLTLAKLDGANLSQADLSHSRLDAATAKGVRAARAFFVEAVLDEAEFEHAVLDEADMRSCKANKGGFANASMVEVDLTDAVLDAANLSGTDLRRVLGSGARLWGADVSGAKVFGISFGLKWPEGLRGDWVDASRGANGIRSTLSEFRDELFRPASVAPRLRRCIGPGDVVKYADLTFEESVEVYVEGSLTSCVLRLGRGAQLTLGPKGSMEACKVRGGRVRIDGRFINADEVGLDGPSELVVSETGALATKLTQPRDRTRFAFSKGCRLRLHLDNPGTSNEE